MGRLTDTLRLCRSAKGLSLSAAARLAGISKAHLHDMESGHSSNPSISTLVGLSHAYAIPVPWLAEQFSAALESPDA